MYSMIRVDKNAQAIGAPSKHSDAMALTDKDGADMENMSAVLNH